MADLTLGTRATIKGTASTTYDGKKCEVVGKLESGRYLVAVDGYSTSSGLRMYFPVNLEPIALTPAPPLPPPPTRFPTLVFEDNFSSIDLTKWSLYDGAGHNGNGIRDPKCWSVSDGLLVGTAWWDASVGKMRTAGMSSRLAQRYGRWEARVRCDPDPSGVTAVNMPLLWPQGEGSAVVSTRGEINIFESTGTNNGARAPMKSYHHYTESGVHKQWPFTHEGVSGVDWHVVAFEWDERECRYYRDGQLVWTVTDPIGQPPAAMVACLQIDALSNRDCGGQRRMYVDYIKIYK